MHPNLSFEQAPPISVPYRFFLTAPWFGVAAGLLLAWLGEDAFASRWTPGILAITHLMVVGFMLQAMCGALLQFIPVAAGGNVWKPRLLAACVHPLLILAAALLVTAFLTTESRLFLAASHLFALALGAYVLVVGTALVRTPGQGNTLWALRFAVVGLAVTLILGVLLAQALGGLHSLSLIEVTQVHAAWGLGGWALMLVFGVSYYVVPMFQLTPAYPAWLAKALPPAMLGVLSLWSFQLSGRVDGWQRGVFVAGLATAGAYAVATLYLQAKRRRKVSDPTLVLFRGAMYALLAIFASGMLFVLVPTLGQEARAPLWIGVLAIPGVFVSVISGMLYKIVPFLNWLHLQQLAGLTQVPPNMRQMITERAVVGQMRLHFGAVAAMLLAVPVPSLSRVAGLLFAASCAWLGWNLVTGVRAYLRFKDRILAAGSGQES